MFITNVSIGFDSDTLSYLKPQETETTLSSMSINKQYLLHVPVNGILHDEWIYFVVVIY